MKRQKKATGVIERIQNHQFRRLFMKNWLVVFSSIMIPLLVCTIAVQGINSKSLLQEMDLSVQRSVRNTKATLETLFEEVCDVLEKQAGDSDIIHFLQKERTNPASFDYVDEAGNVIDRLSIDRRQNLYFSVDAYSAQNKFLTSTLYRGQLAEWISDQSLVQTFMECQRENPRQNLFAHTRIADYLGKKYWLITVYRTVNTQSKENSFVSISIDEQKLMDYIVDEKVPNQGAYLIVDRDGNVILDTSWQMQGETLLLPEKNGAVTSFTQNVNDSKMRVSFAEINTFGWKCVQMIPMEEYQYSMNRVRRIMRCILLLGSMVSILLSYRASEKLFRPVEAILQVLENPSGETGFLEKNEEIQFLLYRILELFQKNITLEREALDRVLALRRVRAKALQEQMTPHFINNVLQTINWIAVEETGMDNSLTSQSIILLADIINTGNRQKYSLTTVEEEIEYTKKFVELERLRYGEGIICHYEVEEKAKGLLIPSISLQTLVENSISHGFRTRCGNGNVYIRVEVNEQEGLYICVDDDGEGMSEEAIKRIFEKLKQDNIYVGEHLGLVNFFQRFRLIYGEEVKLVIRKSRYGGVCVEVNTPKGNLEWLQELQ